MRNCIHSIIETENAVQIIDTANITVFINNLDPIHLNACELPEVLSKMIADNTPVSYLVLKVSLFISHDTDLDNDGNTKDVDTIVLDVVTWDGVCVADWITYIDPETGKDIKHYIREGSIL